MINIQCTAVEAFLYSLIFILLFFGLGYLNAMIDKCKGFSKKESEHVEEEINKIVKEL